MLTRGGELTVFYHGFSTQGRSGRGVLLRWAYPCPRRHKQQRPPAGQCESWAARHPSYSLLGEGRGLNYEESLGPPFMFSPSLSFREISA